MLFAPLEPVVEDCTDVCFYAMTYSYGELLCQMQAAQLSLWSNQWSQVFDFAALSGCKWNSSELNWKLMAPLAQLTARMGAGRD